MLWFVALVLLSAGLAAFILHTSNNAFSTGLNTSIWDSYFSLDFLQVVVAVLSAVGLAVNSVRACTKRFENIPLNLHLIFFLSLFLIVIVNGEVLIYYWFGWAPPSPTGWTVYPPLSALPAPLPESTLTFPRLNMIKLLILAGIFLLAIKTGKLIDQKYRFNAYS